MSVTRFSLLALFLLLGASRSFAGAVIIDGTDANEHGCKFGDCPSTGPNENGWLYMQRALETLAARRSAGVARVVVDLGTTGGEARAAIKSAFNLSSLSQS